MHAATAISTPTPISTQNAFSSASANASGQTTAERPPRDDPEVDTQRSGDEKRGNFEDSVGATNASSATRFSSSAAVAPSASPLNAIDERGNHERDAAERGRDRDRPVVSEEVERGRRWEVTDKPRLDRRGDRANEGSTASHPITPNPTPTRIAIACKPGVRRTNPVISRQPRRMPPTN